jgi:hypothetical protein
MPLCLLGTVTFVAAVLALVRLDILLLQALLKSQRGLLARLLSPLLRQVFQRDTEVQERLYLVRHTPTVLAGRCCLKFSVVCLVDDAIAAVLAAGFGLLSITIALV